MVQGDSAWLWLASSSTIKPETKYQAPASATVRGSERTEANTPSDTSTCHSPGSIHSDSGANFHSITASKRAGDGGGQELLDGLVDHRVRKT